MNVAYRAHRGRTCGVGLNDLCTDTGNVSLRTRAGSVIDAKSDLAVDVLGQTIDIDAHGGSIGQFATTSRSTPRASRSSRDSTFRASLRAPIRTPRKTYSHCLGRFVWCAHDAMKVGSWLVQRVAQAGQCLASEFVKWAVGSKPFDQITVKAMHAAQADSHIAAAHQIGPLECPESAYSFRSSNSSINLARLLESFESRNARACSAVGKQPITSR